MKKISFLLIPLISIIHFSSTRELCASTFGIPDSDTGLLISLVSNTAQQLTRLEQLVNESDKHTKLFRESVELIEERYEVVDQLQSMADNYAKINTSTPSNLSKVNDALEDLVDQKQRIKEFIDKVRIAEKESDQIKIEVKNVDQGISSNNQTAKRQIAKSFGSGKSFSKNMDRVNAQNTSLILKETVSLNGAVNTSNGLIATQNKLTAIQVEQVVDEMKSKDNGLKPISPTNKKVKK